MNTDMYINMFYPSLEYVYMIKNIHGKDKKVIAYDTYLKHNYKSKCVVAIVKKNDEIGFVDSFRYEDMMYINVNLSNFNEKIYDIKRHQEMYLQLAKSLQIERYKIQSDYSKTVEEISKIMIPIIDRHIDYGFVDDDAFVRELMRKKYMMQNGGYLIDKYNFRNVNNRRLIKYLLKN